MKKRDEAEQVLLNGGIFEGGKFAPPKRPTIDPLYAPTERAAYVREQLFEYGKELIEEYSDTFFNQLFYGILFYEVDNLRYMQDGE